jgi:hypothetical protein
MWAGGLVMLIGLAVVLVRAVEMPPQWAPVAVGAVLFLIGAARRAAAAGRDPAPGPPGPRGRVDG